MAFDRGDNLSVPRLREEPEIEVLIPEAVRLRRQRFTLHVIEERTYDVIAGSVEEVGRIAFERNYSAAGVSLDSNFDRVQVILDASGAEYDVDFVDGSVKKREPAAR